MTRSSIFNLDRLIEILINCGFKQFTLLRYKPHENVTRWIRKNPDHNDISLLEKKTPTLQASYPEVHFRIDCAFCFLERNLNPPTALYSGIRGCVAFDRIMSVAPDGSVYPCSQLVGDAFKAGNLVNTDLDTIWNQRRMVRKYRSFRNNRDYKNSSCGKCRAQEFCGGCRVFTRDAIGCDPGCPKPLVDN